ncbi:hypothetical protein V7111_23175, partial [Neobacillus niacini]
VLGTIAALGYMGTFLQNTATFFAAILASVLTVIIAICTKGKYYSKSESKNMIHKKTKKNSISVKETTVEQF